MSDIVIAVRGLSKQYIRGPARPFTLPEILATALPGLCRKLMGRPPGAVSDSHKRAAFWALKDINFAVERGERVGIIGRNGAGKSTLLKILSRIVYPTEGEARIRGRVTSLLEVGTGFNPNLSGRENVYLNASVHGLEKREVEARLEDIVEFAGIRDFLDTPVKHYSSGMFMRLAFSVAAHLDPDILLLDEVLAVGDLSFQQKCLKRVEGLTSEGRTVLFVSHSMEAVARFCDRCIWLDCGIIVTDGPAVDVIGAYVERMLGVRPSQQWTPEEASSPVSGRDSSSTSSVDPSREGSIDAETKSREKADPSVPSPLADSIDSASQEGPSPPTPDTSVSGRPDTRPGNEYVRLVSARVVNARGMTITSAPIDEPLGIEVIYDVLRAGKNVQPALHFRTPQDTYAFVVAYTDPQYMCVTPAPGLYCTTAWVPANLLNAGIMYVTVAMATPDPLERHCVVERALSFNVYERLDRLDGTARGLYAREFPGVVRPKLEWETRQLGGHLPSWSTDPTAPRRAEISHAPLVPT